MPTDDMPFEEEEVEETSESEEGLDLDMGMGALTEEPPTEDPMEGSPMEGEEGGDVGSPEDALAAAIAEHGPDDPAKLIKWLKDYGFELTPAGGGAALTIGVGLEGLGGEEEEEEEEGPGEMPAELDIDSMRNAAASRAFDKYEKGEVPKGRYS